VSSESIVPALVVRAAVLAAGFVDEGGEVFAWCCGHRRACLSLAGGALEASGGLAGEGRFSSRQAVRFAGLDVTAYSSGRKGPPGRLSRQGLPVLRRAVYESGKTHASAPDNRYYAAVKDRQGGKRAAMSETRKILRQACYILTELGDDALAAT
jgi:transposase